MDLAGQWRAAEADDVLRRHFPDPGLDDRDWAPVEVPGHWRSAPAFAGSDGPLFYRRAFAAPTPAPGRRSWLDFDGIFYQGDAWLDGSYLGDTEGYFFPQRFEVTAALAARQEHTLAVEVACDPQDDRRSKHNLTGIFQHWDCIDPGLGPGGIWAPVRLVETGPVRILALRVTCPDAGAEAATLDVVAVLDATEATSVTLTTVVHRAPDGEAAHGSDRGSPAPEAGLRQAEEMLAAGVNRVHWRVGVERPDLWWPHALGDQPLYDVDVDVAIDGVSSDQRRRVTGLRQVRMHNFVMLVNGERIFLKGANLGPTRRALAEATPAELAGDVALARHAGLDLLRVHAHITRRELYEAADRSGMLLWQDLPLQWGYKQVRRQAVRQAREAVDLLSYHPSVAVWCGHNERLRLDLPADGTVDGRARSRFVTGQVLPTWNKTRLDGSIKRALERADGSRPVVTHSGILPHPAWGTDSHLYAGWYHGEFERLPRLLARWPVLARFVSEFGAQAVPATDDFLEPARWPDLDWEHLVSAHSLQKHIFDERVPPAAYPTFDAWRQATQDYQAELIRFHVETLRRLKFRPTGGFCQFLLADAQPGVTWSVLDHERVPKAGYRALAEACAPVIVVADALKGAYHPGERITLGVHAVSDLRHPLPSVQATALLAWPGGSRSWRFEGEVPEDSCVRIGQLSATLPHVGAGPISLDLELSWGDGGDERVANRYGAELRPAP